MKSLKEEIEEIEYSNNSDDISRKEVLKLIEKHTILLVRKIEPSENNNYSLAKRQWVINKINYIIGDYKNR